MTAEQLEELQRFVNRADNDEIDGFDGCDPYWAASLARRVLAAEKLVVVVEAFTTGVVGPMSVARAARAYREASK